MSPITRILAAGAAVAAVATAGIAVAQNYNGPATFGNYTLEAGFLPDPVAVDVRSGGTRNAASLGSPCVGFIADAPDVRVVYTAGNFPITIWAESNVDTTLVINAPDGNWYCNDDTSGRNPAIHFAAPDAGRYEIWVGTYGASGSYADARVFFSER